MTQEATPIPAHIGTEFLLWLWRASDLNGQDFRLPSPIGRVSAWVDERVAFRRPSDTKITVVLTGENPAAGQAAKDSLLAGKVVQEMRIGIRRDDREYYATLAGAGLTVKGLKLPQVLSEDEGAAVLDRMFLYDEFMLVLRGLFAEFAEARVRTVDYQRDLSDWLEA